MPEHPAANAVFDDGSVVSIQQGSYFPVFFSGSHTKRLAHSPENKRVVNFLYPRYFFRNYSSISLRKLNRLLSKIQLMCRGGAGQTRRWLRPLSRASAATWRIPQAI